jgi:uncharacterized protein (DUF3084 family)
LFHCGLRAAQSQDRGDQEAMGKLEFRSPLRKLVAFFRASRDRWKKKCQDAKYELKLLKRRFANLQTSHDRTLQGYEATKAQRAEFQARNEHLQACEEQLQGQIDVLSKRGHRIS